MNIRQADRRLASMASDGQRVQMKRAPVDSDRLMPLDMDLGRAHMAPICEIRIQALANDDVQKKQIMICVCIMTGWVAASCRVVWGVVRGRSRAKE